MHFGLHNSHAHFGDSRARLYPASGPGKGRIYQSMVCIIVVPDSNCYIYICIECLSNGIYSVPIQFDPTQFDSTSRDSALVCSWSYESKGMHHGGSRLRMIQMTHQSTCVLGPVHWKRIPRGIFSTKSFRKMK